MQVRDQNRNRRSLGVLAAICAFLQLAVAPNIALGAGRANIALVFAAIAALTFGGRTGVLAGFFAGLFFDLCSTGPIGLMSLLLTLMSYFLGSEERNRLSDEPAGSLVLFAGASFGVLLAYHLAMLLVGESVSLVDAIILRTLPTYALTFLTFLAFGLYLSRNQSPTGGLSSGLSSQFGKSSGKHSRSGGLRIGRP